MKNQLGCFNLPPWIVYPRLVFLSGGWRYRPYSDYLSGFKAYFESLSKEQRAVYKLRYVEPSFWFGFYDLYLLDDEFDLCLIKRSLRHAAESTFGSAVNAFFYGDVIKFNSLIFELYVYHPMRPKYWEDFWSNNVCALEHVRNMLKEESKKRIAEIKAMSSEENI
ncbi:hypothetical protein [uncultured Thalassolituus sp.]|uniref:hypothetical protein n=1 Tax=uncultured Thalassolituus sp. TaxID=285273 RepID=UPI0026072F69|nr:hypothetical protein [uncultured Thalassolituus sp.]